MVLSFMSYTERETCKTMCCMWIRCTVRTQTTLCDLGTAAPAAYCRCRLCCSSWRNSISISSQSARNRHFWSSCFSIVVGKIILGSCTFFVPFTSVQSRRLHSNSFSRFRFFLLFFLLSYPLCIRSFLLSSYRFVFLNKFFRTRYSFHFLLV